MVDTRQEIVKQIEQLPPALQEQVRRYVASLTTATPPGEKGASLRSFSGTLDPVSAQQMSEAIGKDCEQVDASQW